jgi:universal stress protein A
MDLAISRILVPVDFSPHSDVAVRYAAALAARLGASLELLHVADDPIAGVGWEAELAAADQWGLQRSRAEDAEARLAALAGGVAVHVATAVRTGPAAQTITAFARAGGAGLIVMGTHGRTSLAHVLMGSVVEHVARYAPCPVLTVSDAAALGATSPAALGTTSAAAVTEAALLRAALGRFGTSRE